MMRAVAAVVGLVLGAAAGVLMRPLPGPAPLPAVALAPAPQVIRSAPGCDEAALVDEIRALSSALAAVQTENAIAAAQSDAEIGAPMDWPGDVDPAFTEAGIEAELEAMLDEIDAGVLIGLDCGEYPCTGLVAFDGEALFEDRDRFSEQMHDSPYTSFRKSETLYTDDDRQTPTLIVATLSFPDRPLDDAERLRVGFRMDDTSRTFKPDIQELIDAATQPPP